MPEKTPGKPCRQVKLLPSSEVLHQFFTYEHETGIIRWNESPGNDISPGDIAGGIDLDGYVVIKFRQRVYSAHRIAWKMAYGTEPGKILDHRNRIPWDNRLENLREATHSENQANRKANRGSASGIKGVYFVPSRGRWRAAFMRNRKSVHVGYFASVTEAETAVKRARERCTGEFTNHG